MKHLMKVTPAVFLIFLGVGFVCAQEQDRPMPDRWRGLILDHSTPEHAISILGKPKSDKPSELPVQRINNWITKKRKQKIFRKLKFDKPEGVDSAELYFLDGKLVMIQIDPKEVNPNRLSGIYGIPFKPMVNAIDEAFSPRDYERNQGKVYPKSYPTVYYVVAVSDRSFISGMVDNSSFGSVFKKSMGVGDAEGDMPGKVSFFQLISRSLENRDGADALK